jgi:hypothetical protein
MLPARAKINNDQKNCTRSACQVLFAWGALPEPVMLGAQSEEYAFLRGDGKNLIRGVLEDDDWVDVDVVDGTEGVC